MLCRKDSSRDEGSMLEQRFLFFIFFLFLGCYDKVNVYVSPGAVENLLVIINKQWGRKKE